MSEKKLFLEQPFEIAGVIGCYIFSMYQHPTLGELVVRTYYDEIDLKNKTAGGSSTYLSIKNQKFYNSEDCDPDYEIHDAIIAKAIDMDILDKSNLWEG